MNSVDELRDLGLMLQQSIVLTRIRLDRLPDSPVKARACRTLNVAGETFQHVSEAVQAMQRLNGFVERVFGTNMASVFGGLGERQAAKIATCFGVEYINSRVRDVVNELAAVNAALDEEERKNGKGTEKRAA